MLVRPIDANGDIVPVSNISQMLSGKDAVGEIASLRLHLNYGEWWEDPEIGFRIPAFLAGNARRGDVDLLSKYITSYVSQTEGVRGVSDVAARIEKHQMIYSCVLVVDGGRTVTVEVDIDVF